MRLNIYYIIITGLLLSAVYLAGCCTKKKCDGSGMPYVTIAYQGFADSELTGKALYWVNKNTGNIDDSVFSPYYSNYDRLSAYNDNDLRQYKVVIKFPYGRTDSITSINYALYTESIKCNQCFPFGYEHENVNSYKDFSLNLDGTVYNNPDTLVINK